MLVARLSKGDLLGRVLDALDESGWTYLVESASHPFVLYISRGGSAFRARIYVWNITHGGGAARARDEYRIQVTSGVDRFDPAGVDRTVILGWWEQGSVFAGWDVSKHFGPLGSSPSFQVLEGTLQSALLSGMATQAKANDEIVVAVRPAMLGDYLEDQERIHTLGATETDREALQAVLNDPIDAEPAIAAASDDARRIVIAQVARKVRDSSFAERVLTAYGHSCAMCGVQLRLVDAAHILPVSAASDDSTSNGIALCALHHRAYDRALIAMDEEYFVVVNPDRLDELRHARRVKGLPAFRDQLRAIISLPPSPADRPLPQVVVRANKLRGWRRMKRVG